MQFVRLNILPSIKLTLFFAKLKRVSRYFFGDIALYTAFPTFTQIIFFFLNFDFIIFVNSKIITCLRKVEMKSSKNWISAYCVLV